jgi:serine/threonine-protein kinase
MKKTLLLISIILLITSCGKELEFNTPPGGSTTAAVTTLAGGISQGSSNGTGANASFYGPTGIAVDASGNLYVADFRNNMIRKITFGGLVTTLAGSVIPGSANGNGTYASFNQPSGVAVDVAGNVYVADDGNHLIREISASGLVTTLAGSGLPGSADGTGNLASFNFPQGIAVDASGNVYVADYGNNTIREITQAGVVTTIAGSTTAGSADGSGTNSSFNQPTGVAVDASGNVFVADYGNNLVRKITPAGLVTTIAGGGIAHGSGTAITFNGTTGLAVDASDNIYVTDYGNDLIQKISPAGMVTTLGSGTGGSTKGNLLVGPYGVAVDATGIVYVADYGDNTIRKINK